VGWDSRLKKLEVSRKKLDDAGRGKVSTPGRGRVLKAEIKFRGKLGIRGSNKREEAPTKRV